MNFGHEFLKRLAQTIRIKVCCGYIREPDSISPIHPSQQRDFLATKGAIVIVKNFHSPILGDWFLVVF
jgi:hypothetical protein